MFLKTLFILTLRSAIIMVMFVFTDLYINEKLKKVYESFVIEFGIYIILEGISNLFV